MAKTKVDVKKKRRKCEYCGEMTLCVPALMEEGGVLACPACIVNYHTFSWGEYEEDGDE